MKWQEREERIRNTWHTGPQEHYYTARKGGKHYEVCCRWRSFSRKEVPDWWSHDGNGTNKKWATKEEAMAWCEQDAGITPTPHAGGTDA